MPLDKIMVEGITVECIIGCNEPERYKTQRINVHVTLHIDVSECGRTDALEHTVNYGLITKRVVDYCKDAQCYTIEALCAGVARECLFGSGCDPVQRVTVRIEKPEALKLARWPAVEIERDREFFLAEEKNLGFRAVAPSTYKSESTAAFPGPGRPRASTTTTSGTGTGTASARKASTGEGEDGVTAYLSLGSNLGDRASNLRSALEHLQQPPTPGQYVRVRSTSWLYETPAWPPGAGHPPFLNAACEVYTNMTAAELLLHVKGNVEHRMGRPLPASTLAAVVQGCKEGGWASVGPGDSAARGQYERWGPRVIDVDILLYGPTQVINVGVPPSGEQEVEEEDGSPLYLAVPHPRLAGRDFMLGPLADIAPYAVHPTARKTVTALLRLLPSVTLTKALSFPSRPAPLTPAAQAAGAGGGLVLPLGSRTAVMAILNVTPDSFSDGGQLMSGQEDAVVVDLAAVVARARAMVEAGADILDVGGQSTRAGATLLSAEEEAARVVPAIRAIREALGPHVAISVDTFYAHVATAAVAAGANCVNDISGGTLEPAGRAHMFKTVAALGVPYILMHTRGSPQTMTSLATYAPQQQVATGGTQAGGSSRAAARAEGQAVVEEVRAWLAASAEEALACGIKRWDLVLDPGIGFAKAAVHSFALLGPGGDMRGLRYPLLYGPSRKSFLGAATGKKVPQERVWATAGAVSACVAVGADIVRVHDVEQCVDVVRTADAVYRGPFLG